MSKKRIVTIIATLLLTLGGTAFGAVGYQFYFPATNTTAYTADYQKTADATYGYFKITGASNVNAYTRFTIVNGNSYVPAGETIKVLGSDHSQKTPAYAVVGEWNPNG